MLTLLVVGSVWFWVIIAAECVLLLALIEEERPGLSLLSLISLGLLLKFFGDFDVFTWVFHNPMALLMYFGVYLAAGTVWSVIKWWFYVRRHREEYLEAKENFITRPKDRWEYGGDDSHTTWEGSRRRKDFLNKNGSLAPLARENKSRILLWMGYWPFSAIWTIIDEPIKKAFRAIFNYIASTLQRISDDAFTDVK